MFWGKFFPISTIKGYRIATRQQVFWAVISSIGVLIYVNNYVHMATISCQRLYQDFGFHFFMLSGLFCWFQFIGSL